MSNEMSCRQYHDAISSIVVSVDCAVDKSLSVSYHRQRETQDEMNSNKPAAQLHDTTLIACFYTRSSTSYVA